MISPGTNRRRWAFAAVTAIAGLAGLSLWWTYRPLNATERELVGSWNVPSGMIDPGDADLTLNSDRTFVFTELPKSEYFGTESGTWTADADHVFLRYRPHESDVWEQLKFHARNIWRAGPRSPQYTICWDHPSGKRVPVGLADFVSEEEKARIAGLLREFEEELARERTSPISSNDLK